MPAVARVPGGRLRAHVRRRPAGRLRLAALGGELGVVVRHQPRIVAGQLPQRGVARQYLGGYTMARAVWQADGEARGRARAGDVGDGRRSAQLEQEARRAAMASEQARAARFRGGAVSPRRGPSTRRQGS